MARGKYIAFLDSDDRWLPDKLSVQLEYMRSGQSIISFTDYIIFDTENSREIPFRSGRDKVSYKDEVRFNYLATSTVMYNQEKLGKIYMPDIRNRQDWALWILIIREAGYAYRVPELLTVYSRHAGSISSNKSRLVKFHWIIYKRILQMNYLKAVCMLIRNIAMHMLNLRKKK
jgi:glycosyltransferase involved in cell wall biosynthesis